jgi:hypothetical protein
MIWEKSKLELSEILFKSTRALQLCETIFVTFVTLIGEASYTIRRRHRAPKVVLSREKVCECLLYLRKEMSKN